MTERQTFRGLLRPSASVYALAFIALALPVLVLLALGLAFLWEHGWLLWFALGLAVASLPMVLLRRREPGVPAPSTLSDTDAAYLEARAEWSPRDNAAWECALSRIAEVDSRVSSIEDLRALVTEQWALVARQYRDDEESLLSFSLPEGLLVLETLSRNYRRLILEHFPAAQGITLAKARRLHASGLRWRTRYRRVSGVWRLARIFINPLGGAMGELRGRALDVFWADLSHSAQVGLQRALLEEVSQAAIELYSGRLRVSEQELQDYLGAHPSPAAKKMPPLRVYVAGQVNAGKSSLVNALTASLVAEADPLPSTATSASYLCHLNEEVSVELVDSVGLDGSPGRVEAAVLDAASSDLILYLSEASQPAKVADRAFLDAMSDYFASHLERVMPPLILVSTQVDRLQPQGEWTPPYDLDAALTKKAGNMRDAIAYTLEALGLPRDALAVPVSLAPDKAAYNVELLSALITELAAPARAAQLNRLRVDAADTPTSTREILRAAVRAGKVLGQPVLSNYLSRLRRSE